MDWPVREQAGVRCLVQGENNRVLGNNGYMQMEGKGG
jgi:hypothetical protein